MGSSLVIFFCVNTLTTLESFPLRTPSTPSTCEPKKWKRPDLGWIYLNVDGVVSLENDSGAIGGLLGDHSSSWISSFQKSVGYAKEIGKRKYLGSLGMVTGFWSSLLHSISPSDFGRLCFTPSLHLLESEAVVRRRSWDQHGGGMDMELRPLPHAVEFCPLEHPMEPRDEDRPVKCPMFASSSSSIDDGKGHESSRKTLEQPTLVNNGVAGLATTVEPPVRVVRKRHHTLTCDNHVMAEPLRFHLRLLPFLKCLSNSTKFESFEKKAIFYSIL
ncbi:hypothetical protein GQ457_17G000500 [Hibiscus cannabinus]